MSRVSLVADTCEHIHEYLVSTNGREFLFQIDECRLLMKHSALCSQACFHTDSPSFTLFHIILPVYKILL
jgi:hypothetical protein